MCKGVLRSRSIIGYGLYYCMRPQPVRRTERFERLLPRLLSHSPTTNRYKRPRREAVEGLRSRLDGTVGAYDYDEDEDEDEGEKAEDEKEGRERGVGKECEEVTKEIPGTLGYK